MKYTADRFAFHLFAVSVALLVFGYGVAVGMFHIFPYRGLVKAARGWDEFCNREKIGHALPWYFWRLKSPYPPAVRNTEQAYQGVNLVTRIASGRKLAVTLMDMDGRTLHEWILDWFEIWPDAEHVHEKILPKSPPGTHILPAILMPNGDIVFNFEYLGLVRMDRQGEVVWRLPYRTHHSIELDDDGNLWVCGQKTHTEPSARFPSQIPPFVEDTILVVTPEGEITREWSVAELLRKNNLFGLHYLSTPGLLSPAIGDSVHLNGDVLHLNDVEPFPARLEEGFFKKGDVMVSLRNAHTVLVFDPETDKIKFVCTGKFIRQHDPDFIDGNSFSVFDNNVTGPDKSNPQSRITIVSAPDQKVTTFFKGTAEHPFYSIMMGKHQWLPNGNLLIVESCEGRAFEVNLEGEIVWEYHNYVDEGTVGLIDALDRLPLDYPGLESYEQEKDRQKE